MFMFMMAVVLAHYCVPSTGMSAGFLFGDMCNITADDSSCSAGHCCVRDEFNLELTKCHPFRRAGERCATRQSALQCPCDHDLQCQATHIGSIFGTCHGPDTTTTVLPPCNITARYSSCPTGFCCVRDDFLFTETRCKPLGQPGASCSTRYSEFECRCDHNFRCLSNIHGSHISSIFGKCHDPNAATTMPTDYTTSSGTGGNSDELTTDSDTHTTRAESHQTVKEDKSPNPQINPIG